MDSQWLKMQFELNPHRAKADLARALGLEPPAVSKILGGARQIKAQEYITMRRFFGLPIDGGAGNASDNHYVVQPLSYNDMSTGAYVAEDVTLEAHSERNDWIIPADILSPYTDAKSGDIRIFEVREKTMEPDFRLNEHVLVDTSNSNPSPPGVYVVSDGFAYLIRRCEIVPSKNGNKIRVTANDTMFQPQMLNKGEFKIIGRVIAKLEWV